MAIIAIKNIKAGKTKYRSGSKIIELSEEQERHLVEEGAASYCTQEQESGVNRMSVREIAREVPKIDDAAVIKAMLDQESTSDTPRTTAINALKKKLEELR